jgi:molybdenum cofactor cytidylyltransferase
MLQRLSLRSTLGLDTIPRLAAVGAGGKTTFLFQLAREFPAGVLVTTSTHLAVEQASLADTHLIIHAQNEIEAIFQKGIQGVTLLTGEEAGGGRLGGLPMEWLDDIAFLADRGNLPLLVEADGSRRLPVKAPALHEPAIPSWAKEVVVCVGLNGIGLPMDRDHVHRPEIVAELARQDPGSIVTTTTIASILLNPDGGLKNIPPKARITALLNQADDELREAAGGRIAQELKNVYDTILITSLSDPTTPVKAVYAPTGAIILAAGKSDRFEGEQKVLLDWFGEPFIRHIARTAINANLEPVIVIAGLQYNKVKQALAGLPVVVKENKDWEAGQSTSIQTGIQNLPERVRSVIFLLADQPQVSTALLTALIERHRQTASAIVAPLVEDRRANPVLFDRVTFHDLMTLHGDTGGRAIFAKFHVDYLPWLDRLMIFDVDTQEDYSRLLAAYGAIYDR